MSYQKTKNNSIFPLIEGVFLILIFFGVINIALVVFFFSDSQLVSTKQTEYISVGTKARDIDGLGTMRKAILYRNVKTGVIELLTVGNKCDNLKIGEIKSIPEYFYTKDKLYGGVSRFSNNKTSEVVKAFCE